MVDPPTTTGVGGAKLDPRQGPLDQLRGPRVACGQERGLGDGTVRVRASRREQLRPLEVGD